MIETENGDLKVLIKLKTEYRASMADINLQIVELQNSKKTLRETYIEKAVDIADVIFSDVLEAKPAPSPAPVPQVEAEPESPKCPECDTPVAEGDKFCANCACPLKEENENIASSPTRLTITGSQRRPRRRP